MDGQPLANATVRFAPKDPIYGEGQNGKHLAASVSIGVTDDNGHYTLLYVKDTNGAYVGQHQVTIEAKDASGRERVRPDFNTKIHSRARSQSRARRRWTSTFKRSVPSATPTSTPAPPVQPCSRPTLISLRPDHVRVSSRSG